MVVQQGEGLVDPVERRLRPEGLIDAGECQQCKHLLVAFAPIIRCAAISRYPKDPTAISVPIERSDVFYNGLEQRAGVTAPAPFGRLAECEDLPRLNAEPPGRL